MQGRVRESQVRKTELSCSRASLSSVGLVMLVTPLPTVHHRGDHVVSDLAVMTDPVCPSICREPERDLSSWESRVPKHVAQTSRINTGFE